MLCDTDSSNWLAAGIFDLKAIWTKVSLNYLNHDSNYVLGWYTKLVNERTDFNWHKLSPIKRPTLNFGVRRSRFNVTQGRR